MTTANSINTQNPMSGNNNLSEITSTSTAQSNLGLGSAATQYTGTFLQVANSLSDIGSQSSGRTNLGLGTIATQTASSVAITGGTIDATTIGATTPVQIQGHRPVNAQTGTTYTLALTDSDEM